METWRATAKTLPHAHSSPLFGDFRVSGWGFGVGLRGGVSGFRGGVVMPCAPHGNVARYSKDTSACTLLYLETSRFRGFGVGFRGGVSRFRAGVSGWGRDAVRSAWKRGTKGTSTCTLLYLETSGFRGGVVMTCARMETWHATAKALPHAHSSIWRLQGFGVGFGGAASGRGFGVGFRGGVSGWGRDDMRPAWKRGTPQQGHFHMHTPLFGDFRVSGWGFGVGS